VDLAQELETAVASAERILLLIDFDGTLAPIADDPAGVQLPAPTRHVLQALVAEPLVTVAVLSGRKLEDVKSRIGLPIIYAGNHGLEFEGPNFDFLAAGAGRALHLLTRIRHELERGLAKIPGVLIENKVFGIAVHYRRVSEARIPEIRRLVQLACATAHGSVRIKQAKKLLEIVPLSPHSKGVAARWIRQYVDRHALTIAAGDDLTDEDMFRALPSAITVKVGQGETAARYRLSDSEELCEFLELTLRLVRGKSASLVRQAPD
jgi:trehalose 6-phosphate phosphatase